MARGTEFTALRALISADMDQMLRRQQDALEKKLETVVARLQDRSPPREMSRRSISDNHIGPRDVSTAEIGEGLVTYHGECAAASGTEADLQDNAGHKNDDQLSEPRDTFASSINMYERQMQTRARRMSQEYKTLNMPPKKEGGCQSRVKRVALSNYFEGTFCSLVILNTLFLGFESEFMSRSRMGEPPTAFKVISDVFDVFFVFEFGLRLLAFRTELLYSSDISWNAFDGLLVAISLLNIIVSVIGCASISQLGCDNIVFMKLIRVFRVVRVFRVFRVMRFFRSLRILLYSIWNTLRSLGWTVLLLTLILYIFGIFFTQATLEYFVENQATDPARTIRDLETYYGTLSASILTLFKSMTGGVSWQEVADPLLSLGGFWMGLFIVYIAFTVFAVLNVITAVFCQTALESAQEEKEEAIANHSAYKSKLSLRIKEIFGSLDQDKSGSITIDEFEQSLDDPKLISYFGSMGLEVNEAWTLFKLLDTDGGGIIDVDEFVTGCLRLRGHARSIDIAILSYESRWMVKRFSHFASRMHQKLGDLQLAVEGLISI